MLVECCPGIEKKSHDTKKDSDKEQKVLLLGLLHTIKSDDKSTITGKITDEKGVPLEGASIALKGTNTSTASDVNGFYSIQVPDEKVTLVFASVCATKFYGERQ